ncbi:hypothetical protein B0H19DRAFT_1268675 [Mycena capillaripes]|nr:hypothetical protein B0H19DRAFT_1268675 [Mycena capillaripes]
MSFRSLIAMVFLAAITHREVQSVALTTTTKAPPTTTPTTLAPTTWASTSASDSGTGTTTCITFDFPTVSSSDAGTTTDPVPTPPEGTPTGPVISGTATDSRSITVSCCLFTPSVIIKGLTANYEPSGSTSLNFTCWITSFPAPTRTTVLWSPSASDAGTTTDPVDTPSAPTSTSTSEFVTFTVCTVSRLAHEM